MFMVRGKVLRALRADPEWLRKAKQAKNVEELEQVFVEFGRAKGFKVVEVPT
jgi:hypothetical protein